MAHALVTGPITGRIPTPSKDFPHDFYDVTPDVVYFDDQGHVLALADAIEVEHHVRGTHPLQTECAALDDPVKFPDGPPADVVARHRAEHAALNEKASA
jgi:hypothetical protein